MVQNFTSTSGFSGLPNIYHIRSVDGTYTVQWVYTTTLVVEQVPNIFYYNLDEFVRLDILEVDLPENAHLDTTFSPNDVYYDYADLYPWD